VKIERRQSVRYKQKFAIQFGSEEEFVSSYTLDSGKGGLFLKTDQDLAPGDRLWVQFNLPDQEQSISTSVEVRWIRKTGSENDGAGLMFVDMNRGDFLKLATYLDGLGLLAERGG
jgi:uncharacterized protein (TIGR02266 family)